MRKEYLVSNEEKAFYLKNCPIKINTMSFKKGYLNTLAKEKETGKIILFHIQRKNFSEMHELGNLFLLASSYEADIIVLFVENMSDMFKQVFKWINKKSKRKVEFIIVETKNQDF